MIDVSAAVNSRAVCELGVHPRAPAATNATFTGVKHSHLLMYFLSFYSVRAPLTEGKL